MIWLPKSEEQPPRGTVPAARLVQGDVIETGDGYPVDVRDVLDLGNGTVKVRWGDHEFDGMIVSATSLVEIVGWFKELVYV